MSARAAIRACFIAFVFTLLLSAARGLHAISGALPGYVFKGSVFVMEDILGADIHGELFYFVNNSQVVVVDSGGKTVFEDRIGLEPIAFAAYGGRYVVATPDYIEIGELGQGTVKEISVEGVNDVDLAGDYLLVADMYGLRKLGVDGGLVWSVNETGPLFVVYYDGVNIYAASDSLYRFANDGEILWNVSLNDVALTIAPGEDGRVYVGTSTSIYEVAAGRVEWLYNLSTPIYSIAACGDKVFAASGGSIYVFSVGGRLLSETRFGGHVSYVFCNGSMLYVVTSNSLIEYEKATGVSILSTPEGASVYINGSEYGRTPLVVDLPPGHYRVRLVYGEHVVEDEFSVEPGSSPVLQYTFNGTLEVSAFPRASEVYIDDALVGHGRVSVDLRPGNYTVKARYGGYVLSRRVSVEPGGTTKVALDLEGELLVVTKPEGLLVRLNNSDAGYTPLRARLAPGAYRLEVVSENKNVSELISIRPSQKLNITLVFNATVVFDVTPATSTVYLNGTEVRGREVELGPGNYTVSAICGGRNWTRVIGLSPGELEEVRVVFNTSLEVESVPEGAEVFLNDTKIGSTPLKAQVPAQRYLLEVLYGESGYSLPVDLRNCSGKSVKVVFNGTLAVRTIPPGLEVYVDGKLVGKTPLEARIPAGSHVVEVRYFGLKKVYEADLGVGRYEVSVIVWEIVLSVLAVFALAPVAILYIFKSRHRLQRRERSVEEYEW